MRVLLPLLTFGLLAAAPAMAEEKADYTLTIKNHLYDVSELKVVAGKPFTLKVKNEDATAEEFESHKLKIEKVITAGQDGIIHVQALKPGRYPFVGEYNEDTAKGVIIAE